MEHKTPVEGDAARRSWRRRLVLCAVALALLVVLLVALAPLLVSTFGQGAIEGAFAERFHGRLQLEGLDLGWTGRQRIESARLLDPDGGEVARVSLDLPGLLSLVGGRGRKLGRIEVVASAELVADDAGVTNLDRALEPRAPQPAGEEDRSAPGGGSQTLERLEAEFDLKVERLSWSDAPTRAAGGPVVIEGLQAHAVLAPGGLLDAQAQGRLAGSAEGEIALAAKVEHPFAAPSSKTPPHVDIDLRIANLPTAMLDALTRQEGRLTALVGDRLTLQVRAAGTPSAGDVKLDLEATRARLALRAGLKDGVLRATEGWALDASLDLAPRALQVLLAGSLPEGVAVERRAPAAPLKLAVPRLSVPVAAVLDARARGQDLVAALLAQTELGVSAELGGWSLVAPAWLGGAEPLGLDGVAIELSVVPTAGVSRGDVALRARIAQTADGTIALSAGTPDLLALRAAAGLGRAQARAELRGIPTPLVERLAHAADLLRPALGDALDADVGLDGALAADGALSGRIQFGLRAGGRSLTARLDGTLPPADPSSLLPLPALEARGELSGLELAYAFLPQAQRPLAAELLGGTLAFDLKSSAAGKAANALALQLTGARTSVALAAELAAGALRVRGDPGITLSARPTNAMLSGLLGASLPQGASLALREDGSAVTFAVRSLELALPQAEQPSRGGTAELLAAARAEFELDLPALVWRQPPAGGGGEPIEVELAGLRALVTLEPSAGLTAHASGSVSGQAADGLDLRLRVPDPAGLAAGTPAAPLEIEARASGLPTALIDAFSAQKGLLVDVLGPAIDLELSGRWPDPGAPLRASMRSTGAEVALSARLVDGVLVAEQDEGLSASTPLTPLYSQRIVGRLVPLLVSLDKPAGAPPVGLSVRNFRLPLDGNLRGLDADVELDLNQVGYQLLPGLEGLGAAAAAVAPGSRSMTVPPLKLSIRQGVARYERIPLEVAGHSVAFAGAFDLATLELDFTADVPLSLLGSKVSSELEKVREYIDLSMPVPIQLKGTWQKPRLSIGKEFLEAALKNAAEGALKGGLKGLLDRKIKGG